MLNEAVGAAKIKHIQFTILLLCTVEVMAYTVHFSHQMFETEVLISSSQYVSPYVEQIGPREYSNVMFQPHVRCIGF